MVHPPQLSIPDLLAGGLLLTKWPIRPTITPMKNSIATNRMKLKARLIAKSLEVDNVNMIVSINYHVVKIIDILKYAQNKIHT